MKSGLVLETADSLQLEDRIENLSGLSDEELALRYQEGDESAFNELYNRDSKYRRGITVSAFNGIHPVLRQRISMDDVETAIGKAYYLATREFDEKRGCKFHSFLHYKIKGEITLLSKEIFGAGNSLVRTERFRQKSLDSRISDKDDFYDIIPDSYSLVGNLEVEELTAKLLGIRSGLTAQEREIAHLRFAKRLNMQSIRQQLHLSWSTLNSVLGSLESKLMSVAESVGGVSDESYVHQVLKNVFGIPSRFISNHGGLSKMLLVLGEDDLVLGKQQLHKWNHGEDSVRLALSKIRNAFYAIPGYKDAEESADRDSQVDIINEFIKYDFSYKWCVNHGLKTLCESFIDASGVNGFKVAKSPLALIEFYDNKTGFNWFDRTQEKYVQKWRIKTGKMFGFLNEESRQRRLEAFSDGLYTLPVYRDAEKQGNRNKQLECLDKELFSKIGFYRWVKENGLTGCLIQSACDPNGVYAPRRINSSEHAFRFYDSNLGAHWFNESLYPHIAHVRGRLRVYYSQECEEQLKEVA